VWKKKYIQRAGRNVLLERKIKMDCEKARYEKWNEETMVKTGSVRQLFIG
jgi:hypothetical protein